MHRYNCFGASYVYMKLIQ